MAVRITSNTKKLIFDNPSPPALPCSAELAMWKSPVRTGGRYITTISSCGERSMHYEFPSQATIQEGVRYPWQEGAFSIDGGLEFYLDDKWHDFGNNFAGTLTVDGVEYPIRFHVVESVSITYEIVKGRCTKC